MEKLYLYILQGIKQSPTFYNPEIHQTFEKYLASLQEPVKSLRESYKPNTVIKVDYSESQVQAAYLICYYPHHVEMTFEILKIIAKLFTFGKEISACFFGAGPCPEVAGLAHFMTKHYQTTESLIVNVYDIASDKWEPSRALTKNFVLPSLWKGQISENALNLNLCSANGFEEISHVIEKSNIFIFQNCLNEIQNISATQENINFLLDRAPLDSFIIIADLLYDQNIRIVNDIVKIAEKSGMILF